MAGKSDITQRNRAAKTTVNYKETANRAKKAPIIKSTQISCAERSTPNSSATGRISINGRLSTINSRTTVTPPVGKSIPRDKTTALESRVASVENLCVQLQSENAELKQLVTHLQVELSGLKDQLTNLSRTQAAADTGVTIEQQDLNENIIIRGVEIKDDTPESELIAVYNGLRTHLGIVDTPEFDPVSIGIIPTIPGKQQSSSRPLQVKLSSTASKRQFLQIRRAKKNIFPSDIGINQTSNRPVLITEHLSRSNQELLYRARSLRGRDNYNFVWSCNGQILIRRKENTKVVRIIDSEHVNRLRTELGLPPLP